MIVIILTFSPPARKQEVAQNTVELAVPEAIQPIEAPVVRLAEVKPEASGIERVYCGSPKQRNWKNSNATNIAIGQRLAAKYGWTGSQFIALKELWSCESSWTTTAGNKDSGAYGIPQSLPAGKMASVGSDYKTNPETQIVWGLDYISKRYTTPQNALDHHYTANWY